MNEESNISEEMARRFDQIYQNMHAIIENQIVMKDYILKLSSQNITEEIEKSVT